MAILIGSALGNIALELNGKPAGWLRRLQPPGYEVASAVATGDERERAKIARQVTLTPVSADFDVAGPGGLVDWALTLPRRLPVAMDGAAQLLDMNFKLRRRIEWSQALLTEVRLPELDASSRARFSIGLTWQPETVRFPKVPAGAAPHRPSKLKSILASNFRVTGLPFDASGVIRVALPTVRAKLASEELGTQRLPNRQVASVDLGQVCLEIGARSADAVLDWVGKVVADGGVSEAEIIDFGVELLDPTFKAVLATISLRACSLAGYAEFAFEANTDKSASVALRFNVGDLDITVAP